MEVPMVLTVVAAVCHRFSLIMTKNKTHFCSLQMDGDGLLLWALSSVLLCTFWRWIIHLWTADLCGALFSWSFYKASVTSPFFHPSSPVNLMYCSCFRFRRIYVAFVGTLSKQIAFLRVLKLASLQPYCNKLVWLCVDEKKFEIHV